MTEMSPPELSPSFRVNDRLLLTITLCIAICGGVAMGLRYGLMQSDSLAAACVHGEGLACNLRHWLPQLFIQDRIGYVSLALAVVAWLTSRLGGSAQVARARPLAWVGLALGVMGLVLYAYDPAAVGALLSLVILASGREPGQKSG